MPTYEYKCERCAHRFDVVQSFTDRPKRRCPACKQAALRKVLHPAGIIFKGSGFYKTDSRSGGPTKADTSDAPKSDTAKSDTAKSDSKPAAAAASTPAAD